MRRNPILLVTAAVALLGPAAGLLRAAEPEEYDRFLEQVAAEMRVAREARRRARKFMPPAPPGETETLLAEERAARQLRRGQEPAAPEAAPKPPTPRDLTERARELVRAERARGEAAQADRVDRLLRKAREHGRAGRLRTAERALRSLLRMDPRHRAASTLLAEVRAERTAAQAARTAQALEDETRAALRAVDQARVPYGRTLVLPPDWEEETGRAAAESLDEALAARSRARAEVERKLGKKISLDAVETPVADLAGYFRHVGDLNIVVEKEAGEKTVTLQLRDVSLRTTLDWVTRLSGLGYAIRDGCVHIGPPERIAEEPVVRIYEVSDILHVRRLLTRGRRMKRALNRAAIIRPDDDGIEPFEDVEVKSLAELADDLIAFLKEVTGPGHWGQGAGSMEVRLGKLVVNAPPSMQARILDILAHLRQ
jgi:hypothetical protein